MFVESNRTVQNSTKMTIFIAILLGAYSSNGIGGTPKNYAWLNSSTIVLCFLNIVETQFGVDGKEVVVPISVSSKTLFF